MPTPSAKRRTEIKDVLNIASKEIAELTGAPLSLTITTVDRPLREQNVGEQISCTPAPREKVEMIVLRHQQGQFEPLADITFGEVGYPVALRWVDQYATANERQ